MAVVDPTWPLFTHDRALDAVLVGLAHAAWLREEEVRAAERVARDAAARDRILALRSGRPAPERLYSF